HPTRLPPTSPLFPYTTLFRSRRTRVVADDQIHHSMHEALRACTDVDLHWVRHNDLAAMEAHLRDCPAGTEKLLLADGIYSLSGRDRKSTRLNSSHVKISYAVF